MARYDRKSNKEKEKESINISEKRKKGEDKLQTKRKVDRIP